IWPPVIDWMLSTLAVAIGGGSPSPRLAETVAAFVPPLVGAATVVALYALARRMLGREVAIVSAFLLAVMNGHVLFTTLGRPDNEMMEPLMAALLFTAYLRLRALASEPSAPTIGRSARAVGLCAAAAFALLLFWRGGTL